VRVTKREFVLTLRVLAQAVVGAVAVAGCYRSAAPPPANGSVPCAPGTPRFTGDTLLVTQSSVPLKGRVVDFATGAPVRVVVAQWIGTRTATAPDSTGLFQMPVDTPGTYRLAVRGVGYIRFVAVVRWKPAMPDSAPVPPDTSVALPVRLLALNCGVMD
jgi:hypothetical protein